MFAAPEIHGAARDVLPLAWYEHQPGGFSPAIDVTIGASPLRLGVDTGSSLGSLYRASAEYPMDEIQLSDRQTTSRGILYYLTSTPARLTNLRVGRTLHQPFGLDVSDEAFLWDHHPIGQNGNLGMAFLLRYRAVCFAWDEQRLHLGTLGPCAGGVEPAEPFLRGSLLVGFGVQASDGARFTATVDTGAWHTNCSAAFREANGGGRGFRLGTHPALGDDCLFDESVLYGRPELDAQISVRMNFLLRFSAFGWQRQPLRVFFVPGPAR